MTAPPFERIVFDCDSTLTRIEGIEELCAGDAALRARIEQLTADAMAGTIAFDEVYARRMEILKPRQLSVMKVGSAYIQQAVPGGRELFAALRSLGKQVLVVSGGLQLAVNSFSCWLGLRDEHVHAVKVLFDGEGRYVDFDRRSPLTRNGGKAELLASLPKARTVVVGDGITDAETRTVADAFICFGGVVLRDEVAAKADAVVTTRHLAGLLPLLCSPQEREVLSRDPRQATLLNLVARE